MSNAFVDLGAQPPLVPPADRPFVPVDQQETVQETVWFNPTERDVVLKLHVGTKPVYAESQKQRFREIRQKAPLQFRELRTGERTLIIPKKSRRAISSEFDQAIQQTQCLEAECVAVRMYCRDRSHHKQVMGGLGPHLVNESVQHRSVIHPSLIAQNALDEENKQKAYAALLAKQAADTAIVVAQAKILEAEAAAKHATTNDPGHSGQNQPAQQPAQQNSKQKEK